MRKKFPRHSMTTSRQAGLSHETWVESRTTSRRTRRVNDRVLPARDCHSASNVPTEWHESPMRKSKRNRASFKDQDKDTCECA